MTGRNDGTHLGFPWIAKSLSVDVERRNHKVTLLCKYGRSSPLFFSSSAPLFPFSSVFPFRVSGFFLWDMVSMTIFLQFSKGSDILVQEKRALRLGGMKKVCFLLCSFFLLI